jgi:hypothetical protein
MRSCESNARGAGKSCFVTPPKSALAFKLKTLFMGSDGTIPEGYARTVEKKQVVAWIKEGLIEHRRLEKLYALTPKGENRIK